MFSFACCSLSYFLHLFAPWWTCVSDMMITKGENLYCPIAKILSEILLAIFRQSALCHNSSYLLSTRMQLTLTAVYNSCREFVGSNPIERIMLDSDCTISSLFRHAIKYVSPTTVVDMDNIRQIRFVSMSHVWISSFCHVLITSGSLPSG